MMNKSKKVKMLSKCYTFLAFATCTILCTSSKDAKAMISVGKLGPRLSILTQRFGGARSENINYGIVGGSTSGVNLSGTRGRVGYGNTGIGSIGRGYSNGYHTGTGGGGFSSNLSGIRLAISPPKYPVRDFNKLSLSGKTGSGGRLTNLSVSSGEIGGVSSGTRYSPNIQKMVLKIQLTKTSGNGTKEFIFGNESITSSTGGNGGKNSIHSINLKGRVIRN